MLVICNVKIIQNALLSIMIIQLRMPLKDAQSLPKKEYQVTEMKEPFATTERIQHSRLLPMATCLCKVDAVQ